MVSKILTLAAASAALGLAALSPASAFDPRYDNLPDPNYQQGYVGYNQPYGYGPYGYGRPDYGVTTRDIAICPPGYHLGRSGALCWPN